MKKSLTTGDGISMSQAQSISNSCNQRLVEIERTIEQLNNCSKTLEYNNNPKLFQVGNKIPHDFTELVLEKGKLAACIAYLRECIKYKNDLITEQEQKKFIDDLKYPDYPELKNFIPEPLKPMVDKYGDTWGWQQLSEEDIVKYLIAEAMASQIGNVIHKDRPLDLLRKELGVIKPLEFYSPNERSKDNVHYPVVSNIHHTPEELLEVHEKLAAKHREYEKIVNSYKRMVKDSITIENARISEENAKKQAEDIEYNKTLMAEYHIKMADYEGQVKKLKFDFEASRNTEINKLVSLKIKVNPLFQDTINKFNKNN